MIKSMTGYGVGIAGRGKNKVSISIRSVNSRFLEINFRGLHLDPEIETEIIKLVEPILKRGNIQIRSENNKSQDQNQITFNKKRFETIKEILKNIHVIYGQRLNLSDIISTNDLLFSEEVLFNSNNILKAITDALGHLVKMREKEGKNIYDDILNRLDFLNKSLDEIEKISILYQNEKRTQLEKKVSELLDDDKPDSSRLIQEVAYYTERSEINEEIVRSRSHINQIGIFIQEIDPVGKKINFLLQEIGREVNTIGSKSPQTSVTIKVVEMKSELEKIREQAQNIL